MRPSQPSQPHYFLCKPTSTSTWVFTACSLYSVPNLDTWVGQDWVVCNNVNDKASVALCSSSELSRLEAISGLQLLCLGREVEWWLWPVLYWCNRSLLVPPSCPSQVAGNWASVISWALTLAGDGPTVDRLLTLRLTHPWQLTRSSESLSQSSEKYKLWFQPSGKHKHLHQQSK